MSLYRNKYKYQLIHPVVGTRAYQTTSLKKGAKKCYEELKSLDNISSLHFTILNIDTYETYKFKINHANINKIQTGGDGELVKKVNSIQDAVNKLNSRVRKLEDGSTNYSQKMNSLPLDNIINQTMQNPGEQSNKTNRDNIINQMENPEQQSNKIKRDNIINQTMHNPKQQSNETCRDNIINQTMQNPEQQSNEGNRDDIIAEAVSKKIYNTNIKRLNRGGLLDNDFNGGNKIVQNLDQNLNDGYCIII